MLGRRRQGWSEDTPDDVYFYVFSFLGTSDLVVVARVCRAWHNVAYSSFLWGALDLSRHYYMCMNIM